MKKYRIHFIYLLIIGALAVTSRLKTNELEKQVERAEQEARSAMETAEEQATYAERAAREAAEQVRLAMEQLEECQNNQ